jgi:hypothetical protein
MIRILLSLLFVFSVAAGASISQLNSSVKWSQDGTRVLVMLSPDPRYDLNGTVQFPDGRLVNLHDNFCNSGVYDTLTLEPVWQAEHECLR